MRKHDQVESLNMMEKGVGKLNAFQFHWRTFSEDLESVKRQAWRLSLAMTEGLAWLRDSAVNKKDGSPALMKLAAHQNKPIQKIITMCGEL